MLPHRAEKAYFSKNDPIFFLLVSTVLEVIIANIATHISMCFIATYHQCREP